ncbi:MULTISPECIES: acyl carrier protein [Paenibacillus]|jgi:acyl carrier protein|uniref:Acyl carrier protein n=1 Tax=Paenibacillus baimaensis TaxID=2982185 RepID=A0ABT2UT20_9BACL|nr:MULTISPECIES: acyl carrier protein [Paenibacillus]MCU6797825.1 acyl carrier protein [Paenibacillus sp. WQ 127069]OMF20042.1 D-alanyl carrier protein [Paenibacillus sp. FSL H7-0331]SFL80678.1 Acyl carrier protein [Paenibacillus sp. 1_12]
MLQEKIIGIISEIKNEPELLQNLQGSSDVLNDGGLDSLQLINFILRVEDEFNIEIDFDEFDMVHLNSIDTFCYFIESQSA